MRLHEGGDSVATIRLQRDKVADQRIPEPVVVDTARRDSLNGRKRSSFHGYHHGNGRPFRVEPDNPPRGDDTAHLNSCRYADRKETDDYFSSL